MNICVIGAQWGDEGKGKIVDLLAENADVVVRFQGGHNAGHTLQIDGKTYKLHILPSGIVRKGKISVIGSGVVLDPFHLAKEIELLRSQGVKVTPENLKIAENCPLILPFHGELDRIMEERKRKGKIGTTGRGIGPAYEDKVARRAIRLCDLRDTDFLAERLENQLLFHNALRTGLGFEKLDEKEIYNSLLEIAKVILPFSAPVSEELHKLKKQNKKIMFEGAQGTMLDVDFGTYPFVTSSNTISSQCATGSGLNIIKDTYNLAIVKAYTTRVGEGPFPSELDDEHGTMLGERGHEFGTTTGRKRRCGWFDAVLVRQAMRLNAIDGICLTKIDVLDSFEKLKICVGYELDGKKYDYMPFSYNEQANIKPIYEEIDGWLENTEGVNEQADLPANALKYIKRLEELCEAEIAMVSTSPERNDTIFRQEKLKGAIKYA